MKAFVAGEGTSGSQPGVLRQRLEEAGVRHGETVVANLRGVRVETVMTGPLGNRRQAQLFFCAMAPVEIVSREGGGDEQPLPYGVALEEGFAVPNEAGFVDMLGVRIHPNGMINLASAQEVRVEGSDSPLAHSET